MKILITGGAGFIGANFVHYWRENHPADQITVLDKLTYAGNLENLSAVRNEIVFIQGDVADPEIVKTAMHGQDCVVHFAAETHVDRSIHNPYVFTQTNALGTHVLLETARQLNISRFHYVSTDEVFGQIPLDQNWKFNDSTQYDPRSPYSASKAAGDHLARAYFHTYGLPVTITNCSNNFGPFMHPEKFISRSIIRLLQGKNIRLYTPGNQVRDWLFVKDHCRAIDMVLHKGVLGETYYIGGMHKTLNNTEVSKLMLKLIGLPESRIEFVTDRPGHDQKYDIDWSKINRELGWAPEHTFEEWLQYTITWYKQNEGWWKPLVEETEQFYENRGEKVVESTSIKTTEHLQSFITPIQKASQIESANNLINPIPVVPQNTPQTVTPPENDFVIQTEIPGLLIIERPAYSDDRGFFRETFRKNHIENRFGSTIEFIQANHSRSTKGTLRGIHIAPWHKLITVTRGEVQAVLVDTRPYSPTFGKVVSLNLSDKYPRSIFVPAGCGNSFLVLSDEADYTYLASDYWAPGKEFNVAYDDPTLNIPWLSKEPNLSDKDKTNPTLKEVFPEKFI